MKRLHFDRPVRLEKLHDELLATVPSLRPLLGPDGYLHAVMNVTGSDAYVDLDAPDDADEQAIADVIAAHDPTPPPPPVVFSSEQSISGRIRTTDATPATVYRLTLTPLTGYAFDALLIGVDAASGTQRQIRASVAAKRLNAGAVLTGAPIVYANHQDAAAATWGGVSVIAAGNDLLVQVAGLASRSIDWSASGVVQSFSPGGLP